MDCVEEKPLLTYASLLQQVAARHVEEKFNLSEQLEEHKSTMAKVVKEKDDEIADLKLLVGQHAAETLEARTLLQVIVVRCPCGGQHKFAYTVPAYALFCMCDCRVYFFFDRIAVATL